MLFIKLERMDIELERYEVIVLVIIRVVLRNKFNFIVVDIFLDCLFFLELLLNDVLELFFLI